jgi:hypothetical protein
MGADAPEIAAIKTVGAQITRRLPERNKNTTKPCNFARKTLRLIQNAIRSSTHPPPGFRRIFDRLRHRRRGRHHLGQRCQRNAETNQKGSGERMPFIQWVRHGTERAAENRRRTAPLISPLRQEGHALAPSTHHHGGQRRGWTVTASKPAALGSDPPPTEVAAPRTFNSTSPPRPAWRRG